MFNGNFTQIAHSTKEKRLLQTINIQRILSFFFVELYPWIKARVVGLRPFYICFRFVSPKNLFLRSPGVA